MQPKARRRSNAEASASWLVRSLHCFPHLAHPYDRLAPEARASVRMCVATLGWDRLCTLRVCCRQRVNGLSQSPIMHL